MRDDQTIQWAERLSAIARTGLAFTESLYEQERFTEILSVAAEMKNKTYEQGESTEEIMEAWLGAVVKGIPGYVTPKVAAGAVVRRNENEVLLIKRSDSGHWLYPTGWADIGYSPSEVAVKEVKEETGIVAEVVRPIAIFDSYRLGIGGSPFYSLVFLCEYVSGDLLAHPDECDDLGWFSRDLLPTPLAGSNNWVDLVFEAISNPTAPVFFDEPRSDRVG